MNPIRLLLTALILLVVNQFTQAQNFTNKGKEFWVGYGHHQFFENNSNTQEMVIYLSAEEPAIVTVTIDSSGSAFVPAWSRTYVIPANTVQVTERIPKGPNGGGSDPNYDARLFDNPTPIGTGGEGHWRKKGIHITSNVPVVAYAHIYGSANSGATMLMPIETWGYSYTAINSRQRYASDCYSWLYVVAKDDNTVVEITPSVPTRRGKPAGVPFTVTLMKGQMYQIIGQTTGNDGLELTGTKVRSIANSMGVCYPVAVFCGSSRTYNPISCGSGGGDNDNQQMFPEQAWGKRYLTAPTSSSTAASTFMRNSYKIAVKDPTTIVKRNGTQIPIGSLTNNYYFFESTETEYIEADKPIMVAQFMTGGSCLNGSLGDPEMIYLSPIEQAIKKVNFYRNNRQAISLNYLTLIIPTPGLASLRIDGSSTFDHVYAHNKLPGYSVVVKRWTSALPPSAPLGQCLVTSDSGFNAITYGLGSVESYGYNAGTYINNLSAVGDIHNFYDTSALSNPYTCRNTPMELSVLMAYPPVKMVWKLSELASILTPNADVTVNNPVAVDTVIVNGITYYKYTLPGTYTFSAPGTYEVPLLTTHPTIDNCTNTEEVSYMVTVRENPTADFSYVHSGCLADSVQFSTPIPSGNGYTLDRWEWTFHDATTSNLQNPYKHYGAPGTYNVTLKVISAEGCVGDTTKPVDLTNVVANASIVATPDSICQGGSFIFTDTSTTTGVPSWYWNFGNGQEVTVTTNSPQSVTYPNWGTYLVKHKANTTGGTGSCAADTVFRYVKVFAKPNTGFTFPAGCLPANGPVQFTDTTTVPDGQAITSWSWDFGDGNSSSLQNPQHTFTTAGNYNVVLTVTTAKGCSNQKSIPVTIVAAPVMTVTPNSSICIGGSIVLTASGASSYTWSPATGLSATTGSSVTANPATTTTYTVVGTTSGCTTQLTVTVTVNPKPAKPVVIRPVNYCQNDAAIALSATAAAGNTLTWYNNPGLTGGTNVAPVPSTATAGTTLYYVTQTNANNCESDTSIISVITQPAISNNAITADQTICSGSTAATLNGSATPSGGDGSYTYQWQSSIDGGATWTNVIGATSATYAPGNLTVTTMYRRLVNSGLCFSTSNIITITVQGSLTNYEIAANQTICEGVTPALLDGQTPAGGSGTFTYQWESSTDNVTYTAIAGATAEDYQPPALTATTFYRRKVTSGNCNGVSAPVYITVTPTPMGSITGPITICAYDPLDISFTATSGGAPYSVELLVTAPGGGTTTLTQAVAGNGPAPINILPANSVPGTYTIALAGITDAGGCTRTTGLNSITVNVTAKPVLTVNTPAAICEGQSTTLTASGAASYNWSPSTGLSSTTGSTVTANPATTTTYTITGSNNGCNADAITVTVTVNQRPAKPVAQTPVTYCQNDAAMPLTATAGIGSNLTWYDNASLTGGTATAPTPSTTTAGTLYYYVTQTNSNGCISDTSRVEVVILPAISNNTISSNQSLCSGSSAAPLTGSGSVTGGNNSYAYQWHQSTDGGATWTDIAGATSATYDPQVVNTTTSYRRIVNSALCSNTSNVVTITVTGVILNTSISADQTICANTVPNLIDGETATGGNGSFVYLWESSSNGINWTTIPGATGEDYQPLALTNTTHYRRKTTSDTCSVFSAPVIITVTAEPNANITGENSICAYETASVTLQATSGTAPYNVVVQVTTPGGTVTTINQTLNDNDPVVIPVVPFNSPAGNYTVTVSSITDNNSCSKTTGFATVTIVVKPQPAITVAAPPAICEGLGTQLDASGADSYVWSPSTGLSSTTGSTVTANPLTTTSYQVIGTTNGCNDTTNVTVSVNPRPVKPMATTPIAFCQDDAATSLTASGTGSNSLTWYDNTMLINGTTSPPVPSTTNPGTVYYYVSQTSAAGCESDTSRIAVTVHPKPIVDFNLPAAICKGDAASFTNNSNVPDNSGLTYSWDFGDGSAISNVTNPSHTYTSYNSYSVTLTATSGYGCQEQQTQTLPVSAFYDSPIVDFSSAATVCQNESTSFTNLSTAPNSTITSALWSFGDGSTSSQTNPNKAFSRPGTFTVKLEATNAQGCKAEFSKDIVVYLQPVVDAGRSFVVPLGTIVQFAPSVNDTTMNFLWTPSADFADPTKLRQVLTVNKDETYTLSVTGQGGCVASDFMTVKVQKPIEIPNSFSPNGDGIFDTWIIKNINDYQGASVEVYNRYGQQVFYSVGYNRPWDGTLNGKPVPFGTYYYVVQLKNGFKPMTGSVTIIR